MGSAVKLREDYSASDLRRMAKRSKDANQSRRLLSLAAVREGKDRTEAAKIGGMDRQTLRDWVHRFNAQGPDGLARPSLRRPEAALDADAIGGVVADRRDRSRPEDRWGRAMATDRLEGGDLRALRRRLSRAQRRQVAQGARLLPRQRQAPTSRPGCAGDGGI